MRFLQQAIGPVIFAIVGTAAAYVIANSALFDPNAACVSYSREISSALTQYIQDNDEKFPDMSSASAFQADMAGYVSDPKYFKCPATGRTYDPNSSLSFQSVSTLAVPSTTEAFRDRIPHADGLKTVTYVDGTVKRGGVIQGDLTALCIENEQALVESTLEYTQDYDEKFPPMNTPAEFKAAVQVYDHDESDFKCPVTGKEYVPDPELTYQSQAIIVDPATTWVVADAIPHPDGYSSIGYVDGHVVHGDLQSGRPTVEADVKSLGLAVLEFAQDYSKLPPMDSYPAFVDALLPYVGGDTSVFYYPGTNTRFVLNTSIGNKPLSDFPDRATVLVLHSPYLNAGGTLEAGYLDGHVTSTPYYTVSTMSVGSDNQNRLVWSEAAEPSKSGPNLGNVSVWTLSASGAIVSKDSYLHSGRGISLALSPDTSSAIILNQGPLTLTNRYPTDAVSGPMGDVQPQINPEAVWSLTSAGAVTAKDSFGPFDGWRPLAIAARPDHGYCALWTYFDGTAALWFVSKTGEYSTNVLPIPPEPGSFAADLAVEANGRIILLWDNPDGTATVNALSSKGGFLEQASFGPLDANTAVSLAVDPDKHDCILWSDSDGSASVWTVTASGAIIRTVSFDAPEWMASSIAYGPDGNLRLLWKNIQQDARLDKTQPNGTPVSSYTFTPYR